MTRTKIGSNQSVLSLEGGTRVFFSYATPVAAFVPGRGYLRTSAHYSQTTSKHLNAWLPKTGNALVPQETIDALIA